MPESHTTAMPAVQPASWAPEVMFEGNSGKWSRNALRFATQAEAESSALALFQRWTLCENWRATPADEPVNYRIENGQLVSIERDGTAMVPPIVAASADQCVSSTGEA